MTILTTPLRQAGLKATSQRQAILKTLMKAKKPMDAESLHRTHRGIDAGTIYRMLEQFLTAGVVSLVLFNDGVKRYESSTKPHHHHLVCDDCGKVTGVTVPNEARVMQAMTKNHRFAVRSHSFELFGLCRSCQPR